MRVKRYIKYKYLKILRLKDSPDKIAKGVALGVGLDFLPIPIISLLVAYIIARIAGFNRVAAVATAAFFKWAVPFFYLFNIAVGKLLQGNPAGLEPNNINKVDPLLYGENVSKMAVFIKQMGLPFLLGSIINGTIAALIVYFLVNRMITVFQKRRKAKKDKKKKIIYSE